MNTTKRNYIMIVLASIIFGTLAVASTLITDSKITTTGNLINLTGVDGSIKVYSKYHTDFGDGVGEALELRGLLPESKPYIGWYGWDEDSKSYRAIGWIGCHYNLTNGDTHSHCSWETLDSGSLNTHFEITYNSSQTRARIKFPSSDVQFIGNQKLYFGDDKNGWIEHDGVSGDMRIKGNGKLTLLFPTALEMNLTAIRNVTTIKVASNTTVVTCTSEGLTFYDGTSHKLMLCNGTAQAVPLN
jgi:hypothetical protein